MENATAKRNGATARIKDCARVGDIVTWRPYPSAPDIDSAPAMVTGASSEGTILSLSIFPRDGKFLVCKDAVRADSDPEAKAASRLSSEAGVWSPR